MDELLRKNYKIIIFDWDGTAVMNRTDDASSMVNISQQLLNKGIILAIITGTSFDNINKQYAKHIKQFKEKLFICCNRGSEVYNFDCDNKAIILYNKKISRKEDDLLDKIVVETKEDIEGTSFADINIIFDRKNRRKIDLLPEWEKPKKNEFRELLIRVEEKLDSSGFGGGLNKAYSLLVERTNSYNFKNAKISSDIKHLEIGITDKSDSIKWLYKNIIEPNQIYDSKILIAGDEFGDIGGFSGSDYQMVLPDKTAIEYISVGIEPNGVPFPVTYIGGGPDMFLEILKGLL